MAPPSAGTTAPRPIPSDDGELLPFLPLIWVAWSDGVLSPEEMAEIRERIREEKALGAGARAFLESWLRPEAPPEAADLAALRERLRERATRIPREERRSLASLGVALARVGGEGAARWGTAQGMRTLEAVEELLGVLGDEAARELVPGDGEPVPEAAPPPPFLPEAMARYLDGPHAERRDRIHRLLREPALRIPRGLSSVEYRKRVMEAVQRLAQAGVGRMAFPERWGGEDDVRGSIASFEALAYGDLSVLVKFGVQFGLFGGSVLRLGTARHHEAWLDAIASAELPGCFAMTERDHGSNVRAIRTRARYLPESGEFEIHTPDPGARKDWLGNAAVHGRMATVFAQLEVAGEGHGVHAFLVPIRDRKGRPLPGVEIEDCGEKIGLHGVDNGRLGFDRVRIPRENLLDRFASVSHEGRYSSPIPSEGRRFFTMLGTLVTGRISIAAASVSVAKTALAVAVRFSEERRQFGPSCRSEAPILDYQAQQRLLLPRVAATYALHFAVRDLVETQDRTSDEEERTRVEVLAAGLKARASRHAVDTVQACREATGGRGYLAENRFGELRADTDVFTTFEGVNVVLLQLVAKGLLSRFREELSDLRFRGMVRLIAERAGAEVTRRNPVRARRTGEETLRDPDVQLESFRFREQRLLETVARRLKHRLDRGVDSFHAVNECQEHLVALADAHVDRVVFESFRGAVERAPDPRIASELDRLRDLWALSRLEAERAWFLEAGYMEGGRTKAIRDLVIRLCGEIRPHAVALVDGFGIPDDILDAPAAFHGREGPSAGGGGA
jgi:acyl-CoA oxidase